MTDRYSTEPQSFEPESRTESAPALPISERAVILLIAAIQFISILEFMIVLPLGPDFAEALGIPMASIGLIGGSYTAAAAVAGITSSLFIERFDRRTALGIAMIGLLVATAAAGLAINIETLIAARIAAGLFGGPAMSLALAIVADIIPPERRGKAMGTVMSSFAVASVLGIPAGLELARIGGWQSPFFVIAGLGTVTVFLTFWKLPPMRAHLVRRAAGGPESSFVSLVRRKPVYMSFLMSALVMVAIFMIVPNIAAYVQHNLGFPRERLGMLYLVGGLVSFVMMGLVGRLVDRYGSPVIGTIGTAVFVVVIYIGFVNEPPTWAVLPVFVAMMGCASLRNVPYQTLTSQVPLPHERARFMTMQSSIQHVSTASGAVFSSFLLTDGAGGRLEGMSLTAIISILFALTLPPMLYIVRAQIDKTLPLPEIGMQAPHIKLIDGKRLPVGNIYCVGRNYADHARELGNQVPTEPVIFLKSSAALRGVKDRGRIAFSDETFHHEAELVLLIAREAAKQEDCCWDAVSHVGLGLDLTRREVQNRLKEKGLPWTKAKSFLGSAIVTPFLPLSALPERDAILFTLKINDKLVQSGNTATMLFPVPTILAAIATLNPLAEGDLVFTGTPPGVGPIRLGDHFELAFDGLPYAFDGIL